MLLRPKGLWLQITRLQVCIIFFLSIEVKATETDITDLPREVVLHMVQWLNHEDAISFSQTCHHFHGYSDDINYSSFKKALMRFPVPRWNLERRLSINIGAAVQRLYWTGRQCPDIYRRYCYLMAAGRAGHMDAAREAGQMLINSSEVQIPVELTLKALQKAVPELKGVLLSWDICQLDEGQHDNPIVADYRKKYKDQCDKLYHKVVTFELLYVDNRYQFWYGLDKMLKEFREIESSCIRELQDVVGDTRCPELEFILSVQEDDSIHTERAYLERVLGALEEVQRAAQLGMYTVGSFFKNPHDLQEAIDSVVNRLKGLEVLRVEVYLKNQDRFKHLPIFWEYLGSLYLARGQTEEAYQAVCKMMDLKLNGSFIEYVEMMYFLRPVPEINGMPMKNVLHLISPQVAFKNDRDTIPLTVVASLLGNIPKYPLFPKDLYSFINYFARGRDPSQEVRQFRREWNPLRAFGLQLNALRFPDQKENYHAMALFYEQRHPDDPMGARNDLAGNQITILNPTRAEAAKKVQRKYESRQNL